MASASSLSEIVKGLWTLARKPLGYIYNLKDNIDSLRKDIKDLKAASDDVKARVEREKEEAPAQRTERVANWLDEVQKFVDEVDQVLQEAGERDRINCLRRYLPPNCWSSYKLGKRVDQILNDLRKLQSKEGKFDVVTLPLPPPQVLEMPMDETVGLDISKFNEVWKLVVDDKQVGVIGLYGMGGVGKTTLMRRIEKELSHANNGFDVVIWVVVSKLVNKDRIQDTMRRRLGIKDGHWEGWSWEERVYRLGQALTRKKFVLLLDDLWERLDLSKIGVPRDLKNGSKVVLTTRLKHVCDHMVADKTLEVKCLMRKEALELFEKSVGKSFVDCHQEIRDLAKDIAEECKGLPLALITVGRAMATKDNPGEWRHALATLRNKPHKLQGMVGEVYHILELSYNSLDDSTRQACFLYCCLFPEDYPIITNQLIELWIGEGLLGDTDDIYSMRDEGELILGDLNRACLLESGHDGDRQYVKMHDVIRDMATWIARDRGQRENKLLVIEKDEDMSAEMISKWGEAKKVSIRGKWIQNIDQIPSRCSQLETLFVRETRVTVVPSGFFDSMTACLAVLNLSDNKHIKSFPEGICNLINLRYLNLSATSISELPKEIKSLTHLRWLLLDDMLERNILIPTEAITSLPLNVFSRWESKDHLEECGLAKEEETIEELGHMQHLTDLSISVHESSSAQKIFQFPNLRKRIRRACIDDRNGNLTSVVITYSPADIDGFSHLKTLYLFGCTKLSEMKITQEIRPAANSSCFPNLIEVWVYGCGLSDLSWLMHTPKLQKLEVGGCNSMERIIGDGFAREELAASRLFSCLKSLELYRLPKLTSICDQALSFPRGVFFLIFNCPGLRKLPLDSSSARRSFEVEGGKHWWAEFEWDPTARVIVQVGGDDPVKEMTFGEAARKLKDEFYMRVTIKFLPRGPSE